MTMFKSRRTYGGQPFHNETNRILATFRFDLNDTEEGIETLAKSWATMLVEKRSAFTMGAGKREIEHAFRVLSRLSRNPQRSPTGVEIEGQSHD